MTVLADHAPSLPATLDLTLQPNDWRVPLSCLSSAGHLPRVTVAGTTVAASLVPDPSAFIHTIEVAVHEPA